MHRSTTEVRVTEPDYYKILGITPAAELPEIRQAYRRRVRDTHPDAGGDEEQFRSIQDAYDHLSDTQLRIEYDASHGNRRPARRGNRTPGRHAKNRKVKAWRVQTTVDETRDATSGSDVMSRPWFIDIDPQRRLRCTPSIWRRASLTTVTTALWLTLSVWLINGVLQSTAHPALRALIVPYALLITAAVVVSAIRTLQHRPAGSIIVVVIAVGAVWITSANPLGVGLALHLVTSIAVPWCFRRLRFALRLRNAIRTALRDYNAFGPSGARPSADRRTGAVLRALLERIPAARLFVRVPIGPHRAEYTVVCGRKVAVITPPLPRTTGDTGAEELPAAVNDAAKLLGGTQVRGFVVWPTLPLERISGTDAVIRHLSSADAAGEIGRWLASDPYTLHLPTLRRLRDRLASGDPTVATPRSHSTVNV